MDYTSSATNPITGTLCIHFVAKLIISEINKKKTKTTLLTFYSILIIIEMNFLHEKVEIGVLYT